MFSRGNIVTLVRVLGPKGPRVRGQKATNVRMKQTSRWCGVGDETDTTCGNELVMTTSKEILQGSSGSSPVNVINEINEICD